MKKRDNTPIVMRGSINGKATYARIPIKNNFPLPDPKIENEDPITSLKMYLKYIGFISKYKDDSSEEVIICANKALRLFENFEVVNIETEIR